MSDEELPADWGADDVIWFRASNATRTYGDECARLRDQMPYDGIVALDHMINHLMTELWDHSFSQSEIRAAFEGALADMNRYAAGDERRK